MRIKTLADATGVEVDTIRYYEKQGLLPEPARQDNGYRDYASTHLERLAFIRHCRALEMPLVDIRTLLGALDAPGEPHPDVDRLVQEQIDKVRVRLQSMRALGVWAAEGIARIEGSGMLGCNTGHECKLYPLLPATAATLTLRTARLAA